MKKVFFIMLVLVLTIALALPAVAVSAALATMTVVSDTNVLITEVYNKAGGGNTFVDLSGSPLNAARAQEPKPYPTGYTAEGAEVTDSVWDNGVNWFEDNTSGADWIWETERAEGPASYGSGDPLYDADAARYGRVVLFETTFDIPGDPISATLHIAADNGYEAWVNDGTHYLSSTVGGPGWETSNLWETNLSTSGWQTYGILAISGSELNSGENTLYVLAGNEYYWTDDGNSPVPPTQSGPYAQYNPGAAIFQLDVEYEEEPFTTNLCAGQDIEVGTVTVDNDGTNITVTYEITEAGWMIMETHLYVGQNTPPTSAPGQFPYDDGDAVYTGGTMVTYTIPLDDIYAYVMKLNKKGKETGVMVADGAPGVVAGEDVYIATHAVVEKVILIEAAPYPASSVESSAQGLRKDLIAVLPNRSTPESGLTQGGEFFSLGFGGEIVVEFDCPIINGGGNDIKIYEVTGGTYPLETAVVFASQDGVNWTNIGIADNIGTDEFDLGSLSWASYIKIVDTSDSNLFASNADGFDLDGVYSLQDCIEIQEETAWGGACDEGHYAEYDEQDGYGEYDNYVDFVYFFNPEGKGNWASFFLYQIQ